MTTISSQIVAYESAPALNTPIIHLSMICALLISGCSQPPILNSNVSFPDNLSGPKRLAVDHKLSSKLPKPDINPSALNAQGLYYSANGHACKRMSATKVACYINGQWLETSNIFKHK